MTSVAVPPAASTVTAAHSPAQPDIVAGTPLVSAIADYRNQATGALHVPGHAVGGFFGAELRALLGHDFLASDVWLTTDDLAARRTEAETLAARAWGADHAWFLLDGSSGGNRVIHLAHQPAHRHGPGRVVVARDSHTSTLAGLVLSGATPHWVTPRLDDAGFGISLGVTPAALAASLADATLAGYPASLVTVVSPGYAGVCLDTRVLATLAHQYGAPLAVDEAWGAHLPFHPDLPDPALRGGADLVVTSAHKMLPALSGAALVLARGERADARRIARAVRMSQTTSPLLPVLASIDEARSVMVTQGRALLDRMLQLAYDARRRLAAIPGVRVATPDDLGVAAHQLDPLRLVVNVRGLGLTGLALERRLRSPRGLGPADRPLAVEGADENNVFVAITAGTQPRVVDELATALRSLATRPERQPGTDRGLIDALLAPRQQACTPRQAHYSPTDTVALRAAVGRISAEAVTPYPPGVPAVMPGERLDQATVDVLTDAVAGGVHIHGTADPSLTTIGVVHE